MLLLSHQVQLNLNNLKRHDLQIIRGFSVLLVLFYHLKIPGFDNGFLGVDIFFVLSGYLFSKIYSHETIINFYCRRLKRILPALLVTISITTIIVALMCVPTDADQRFKRIWFDLTGVSNLIFWTEESYFGPRYFKPLLNLWSLGIELQFYFLVPILLPFLRYRIWFIIILIFISLIGSQIFLLFHPNTSFFLMPFRIWEFLLGVLFAWYPLKVQSIKYKKIILLNLIILIIIILFFYPIDIGKEFSIIYSNQGPALVLICFFTAIIISLSMNSIFDYNNIVLKLFSKIGDYSYSIYLVHFPIIILVNYKEFGGTRTGYEKIDNLFLILFLIFLSSYLLFNYVEKIRYFEKSFIIIFILLIFAIFVGLISSKINLSRYSAEQIKIFSAWNDRDSVRCGKLWRIINYNKNICKIDLTYNKTKILLLGDSTSDTIKKNFSKEMSINNISTYFYAFNSPLAFKKASPIKILREIKENKINNVIILFDTLFYKNKQNLEQLKIFSKLMKENDIKLMALSPIPTNNYHVPRMLFDKTKNPNTKVPLNNIEKHLIKNDIFFNYIDDKLIDNEYIFYTYPFLCPQNSCEIIDNNKPLYFDNGHLTLTGSKKLKPLFKLISKIIIK